MRMIAQPLIIGLMLVGAVAIGVAFVFKTLALLSWLVALLAIISASIILLRQPYKYLNLVQNSGSVLPRERDLSKEG